ncbi:MAG: hypothetical protein ACK559_38110, partial [bacterium]
RSTGASILRSVSAVNCGSTPTRRGREGQASSRLWRRSWAGRRRASVVPSASSTNRGSSSSKASGTRGPV